MGAPAVATNQKFSSILKKKHTLMMNDEDQPIIVFDKLPSGLKIAIDDMVNKIID